jgi:hypothetical protein
MSHKIASALADDSTVWYLGHSMIEQCRSTPYLDRIQLRRLIIKTTALTDYCTVKAPYHTVVSSAGVAVISKLCSILLLLRR